MARPSTTVKSPRIAVVCSTCGSEDVRIDAWAAWNTKSQAWELAETFDYSYCNACEDQCRIEEIPCDSKGSQGTRKRIPVSASPRTPGA